MSTTNSQLREPDQIDWDNYNPGSKYQAPPPVIGPDGKPIQYYVQIKPKFDGTLAPTGLMEGKDFGVTDDGDRSYQVGPLTVVKSGSADGYKINFAYVSTKQFEKDGKKLNASTVGNYLKSAGINSKPQKNAEYDKAVLASAGRVVPVTIDWEARNKDTGEKVSGYLAFPMDPDRPGQRKAILKAGDKVNVLDAKGQPTGEQVAVKSEVLFANARVRYFRDPNKK